MVADQAESLRSLMNARAKGTGGKRARLVAVASGKGGVGKTMFSVNLSLALQQRGERVLLIDADFGLANIDIMLGVTPRCNLSHVVKNRADIRQAVTTSHLGIQFVSGGSGVDELMNLNEEQMAHIMDSFLTLEDLADTILFDLGAGAGDRVLQVIAACGEVIVVTTPEPTAILDAYALIKTIARSGADVSVRLVVNRAETGREGQETMTSFIGVVSKYIKMDVTPLGSIAHDPVVSRCIKEQTPLLIAHPRSAPALQIGQIADTYLQRAQTDKPATGLLGFLQRLRRA